LQDLRACIGAWPAARSEPASPGAPGEAHLPGLSANDRCTPIMIFWPGGDLRTMPALAPAILNCVESWDSHRA
jgi:hypothetical protein